MTQGDAATKKKAAVFKDDLSRVHAITRSGDV